MFKLKWKWCIPNYRLDGFAWVCSWSLNTEKGVFGWDMLLCLFTMRAKCHAHSHDSLWLFQGFISAWPFNPESVHKCAIIGITTQKSHQNCFAIERRSFSSCLIMGQKKKNSEALEGIILTSNPQILYISVPLLGYWELRGELGHK